MIVIINVFMECINTMLFLAKALTYRTLCNNAINGGKSLVFRYKTRPQYKTHINLLQELLGCGYKSAQNIVQKYPTLVKLDIARIRAAAEVLQRHHIDAEEIKECPKVLGVLPVSIDQYSSVLRESGFHVVSAHTIVNYAVISKKKIQVLKAHNLLPKDANVCDNFLDSIDAPDAVRECVHSVPEVNSNCNTISFLRDLVLKCFLQWRLGASEEEVLYIFSTYVRIQHKSLKLIQRTLSILLEELSFPKDHITKHGYLIHAHPDDLNGIINSTASIAGIPIRDILYMHPSIAITSFESFTEIMKILRDAGVPEESIVSSPMIFSLSAQSVRERIPALMDPRRTPPEIKALHSNPKALRLVVHQENVSHRLAFLGSQGKAQEFPHVASLNLLTGSHKVFERFVTGVGGQSRGSDVVQYLASTLRDSTNGALDHVTVRTALKMHSNWRSVPLSEIQACLEMLLKYGFKTDEIFSSIHIVLYPAHKVEEQLRTLPSQSELLKILEIDKTNNNLMGGGDVKTLKVDRLDPLNYKIQVPPLIRKYALPLCLYYLEREHHFSGDGVWFR